jgi:hypothetical protein
MALNFNKVGKFKHVSNDIFTPVLGGLRLVLHFAMDAKNQTDDLFLGFKAKFEKIDMDAKRWFATKYVFKPGAVNLCTIRTDTWILQTLVKDSDGALFPNVLETAIKNVVKEMNDHSDSVLHVAGRYFKEHPSLEELLTKHVIGKGYTVVVYDEPEPVVVEPTLPEEVPAVAPAPAKRFSRSK